MNLNCQFEPISIDYDIYLQSKNCEFEYLLPRVVLRKKKKLID